MVVPLFPIIIFARGICRSGALPLMVFIDRHRLLQPNCSLEDATTFCWCCYALSDIIEINNSMKDYLLTGLCNRLLTTYRITVGRMRLRFGKCVRTGAILLTSSSFFLAAWMHRLCGRDAVPPVSGNRYITRCPASRRPPEQLGLLVRVALHWHTMASLASRTFGMCLEQFTLLLSTI